MKKMDVRVKRIYNQLINALFKLLSEKSFDDLTVIEICNTASVHRATFYKHFVDKYDFLNTCFKIKLSELVFDIPEKSYAHEDVKESCMKMAYRVVDFVENNRAVIYSINNDKFSAPFNSVLTDAIADFIAGRISTMENLKDKLGHHLQMISNCYAGAIVGLVKWWVDDETPSSSQEILEFVEFQIDELCNYFNRICNE